ncbi:MAG: LCP family protein [Nocardioides sp.]
MTDIEATAVRVLRSDNGSVEPLSRTPKRRAKVRKRHVVAKVLTSTTMVMALVVGLSVAYFYRHLNANLVGGAGFDPSAKRAPEAEFDGSGKPLNILVMGSDTRAGAGNNIDGLTELGARSDTTILLHVSANRKRSYGISIPRDSMVDRPECHVDGETLPAEDYVAWNDAFSDGGQACTIEQFEGLTGVRLHHYVVVDFNGFKDMVDAIDGVEVCIPEEIDDTKANIQFDAGTQVLAGDDALNYVRVRDIGNGSDLSRAKRQQAFIASMANKIVSADTLANPVNLLRFLNAATKSLEVDQSLTSVAKLAKLGAQFQDTGLNKIQFFTIPVIDDPQDSNRVIWAPESADEVWQRIAEDKPIPSRLKSGVIKASAPTGGSDKPSAGPSPSGSPDEPSTSPDSEADAELLRSSGLCA